MNAWEEELDSALYHASLVDRSAVYKYDSHKLNSSFSPL
jgi:hypothetical protein